MQIPQVESHLPELMPFIHDLAREFENGRLNSWPMMAERVRAFFSPAMMDKVDSVLPGWREMSSFGNGTTLIHVTSVLASLVLSPEYREATPEHQQLMQWIVLFHDIAKEYYPGQRDHIHGFRSAAMTGRTLPQLGLPCSDSGDLQAWISLSAGAIKKHPSMDEEIQDNSQLPQIIGGIDRIFGHDTPAGLIIKTVLFHMSIDVLAQWPQQAALTDSEIREYISDKLFPLLLHMNRVDNDAWAFFEPERKQAEREETIATFEKVRQIIA